MAACLLLLLGLYLPASAQFENAIWDTLTADTVQDALTQKALAVNGYEEFHLAYMKSRPGTGWNIYYRFFDLYDGMLPETPLVTDRPCFGPVVASRYSDNDYDIVILFESSEDIFGCIAHSPFGPWDCNDISNSEDPDLFPSVAYGHNYYHGAWITYTNSQYKIIYLRGGGAEPVIEVIEDSELGPFGSGASPFIIAVGDVPHVFYRGVNAGTYHIHHAFKPHPDSSWSIEYVMTPNIDDYSASADIDGLGNIYLAISGNEGFGFPGHVYYRKRDHDTGQWSTPQLVTGQNSATNASIMTRFEGASFIVSCGVSGNIYDGHIYLSDDSTGSFQTRLLGVYQSATPAVIANVIGEYGVVVFDAPIGAEEERNIEIVYYGPDLPTSVADEIVPKNLAFSYCYPNPFNSSVRIVFGISRPSKVSVEIFDILGRKVETLSDSYRQAGDCSVTWDAPGKPTGIYFYQIKAGANVETRKMLLLK